MTMRGETKVVILWVKSLINSLSDELLLLVRHKSWHSHSCSATKLKSREEKCNLSNYKYSFLCLSSSQVFIKKLKSVRKTTKKKKSRTFIYLKWQAELHGSFLLSYLSLKRWQIVSSRELLHLSHSPFNWIFAD